MDNLEQSEAEPKVMGVTPKTNLYAHAAKYGKETIDFLVATMRNEKAQIAVRISAANKIIDKLLSNKNAVEGGDTPLEVKSSSSNGEDYMKFATPSEQAYIRDLVTRCIERMTRPPDHVHDESCDPDINPSVHNRV